MDTKRMKRIEEGLPEPGQPVLLLSEDGLWLIGSYHANGMFRIVSWLKICDDGSLKQLTTGFAARALSHWMELEAPEEKEVEGSKFDGEITKNKGGELPEQDHQETIPEIKLTVVQARQLRLMTITACFNAGLMDEIHAKEVLSGPLTPGDESTICDDSGLFGDPDALEKIAAEDSVKSVE